MTEKVCGKGDSAIKKVFFRADPRLYIFLKNFSY